MAIKELTLEKLMEIVNSYLEGTKQDKPVIVWFDCPKTLQSLEEDGMAPGVSGLGLLLSQQLQDVVYMEHPGSPLTNHNFMELNGEVIRLTEAVRAQFQLPLFDCVKFDENDKLITKLYIHSPYTSNIGTKGTTSIEYGLMLTSKLHLSNMIFYPIEWQDKINADLSQYEQFICKD